MNEGRVVLAMALLAAAALSACDQSLAVFPETSGGCAGGCGPWYPGAGGEEAAEYAVAKGEIFPCLVWESVSVDGEEGWLNVGEIHLAARHGKTNAKALVIAVVGTQCAGCAMLVEALAAREDDFSQAAIMVALTHGTGTDLENAPLEEAAQALSEEGWPAAWPITNDEEEHLPGEDYGGIPWIVVVRLSDMVVVERSNDKYSASNAEELLEFINSL